MCFAVIPDFIPDPKAASLVKTQSAEVAGSLGGMLSNLQAHFVPQKSHERRIRSHSAGSHCKFSTNPSSTNQRE